VNGATGIIIWEDWKVVNSWTGYMCIFLLLLLGVYLLSEVDFFEHYHMVAEAGANVLKIPEYELVKATTTGDEVVTTYGAVVAGGETAEQQQQGTEKHVHDRRVFFRKQHFHLMR
jgi:hypothetical protein